MAKSQVKPPEPSGVTAVPQNWVRSLTLRAPDFRALFASWTDSVARRRGLSIYEEMLADPQVAGSVDLLKFAAISLARTISAPKGKENDTKFQQIVEDVMEMVENLPGGTGEFLYNALSAIEYGYSIIDRPWVDKNGKWIPGVWTALPQALFGFELDEKTANPIGVVNFFSPSSDKRKKYPLENFFVIRWNARYNAPYGRSQLHRAYEAWWMKQLIRRMRNTTLDRFGTPLMMVSVPPTTSKKDRSRILKILEDLYSEAGLVLNDNYKVTLPHSGAGQGASEGFQRAIEYEDSQIAKAITGVTLNANESQGTGTYAQARVHQNNFLYWVKRVVQVLEEALQTQIVEPYCKYNYGLEPEECPRLRIQSPEGEDLQQSIQSLQAGQQLGVIIPAKEHDWIREKLGFPAASEEVAEELQKNYEQQQQMQQMQMQQPDPNAQGDAQGQPQQGQDQQPDDPSQDYGSWGDYYNNQRGFMSNWQNILTNLVDKAREGQRGWN